MKIGFDEMAVTQFLIEATAVIAKKRGVAATVDELIITDEKGPDKVSYKYQMSTFKIIAKMLIHEKNPYICNVDGLVTLWRYGMNQAYMHIMGHLEWTGDHYRAIYGDGFEPKGRFLKVWPDDVTDRRPMVDTIDESGLCLINLVRLKDSRSFKSMRAYVMLKDGYCHEGSFNNFSIKGIIMDIGWTTIAPDMDEIEMIWTVPSRVEKDK